MITIAEHTLGRLVTQTRPHMGGRYEPEAIQSIALEHDGHHLYAVATNRYTLAVARTRIIAGGDEAWSALIYQTDIQYLLAAIRLLGAKPLGLERTEGQLILSSDTGTRIAIDVVTSGAKAYDWRKILLPALQVPAEKSQMALSTKFFGAWKSLPDPVQIWSTGENKIAIIVAPDFIGGQMPVRREGEDRSMRDEIASWNPAPLAAAA